MYLSYCWIGANGYLLSSDGIWSNNIDAKLRKLRKSPSKVHGKTDDLAAYFGLAGMAQAFSNSSAYSNDQLLISSS